jgi:hypothetical protein
VKMALVEGRLKVKWTVSPPAHLPSIFDGFDRPGFFGFGLTISDELDFRVICKPAEAYLISSCE